MMIFATNLASALDDMKQRVEPWHQDGADFVSHEVSLAMREAGKGASPDLVKSTLKSLPERLDNLGSPIQKDIEKLAVAMREAAFALDMQLQLDSVVLAKWKMAKLHSVHSVLGFFDDVGRFFHDAGKVISQFGGLKSDSEKHKSYGKWAKFYISLITELTALTKAAGHLIEASTTLADDLRALSAAESFGKDDGDAISKLRSILGTIPSRGALDFGADLAELHTVSDKDLCAAISIPDDPSSLEDAKTLYRAAAAWGAAQGSDYMLGLPNFEYGAASGPPSRQIILLRKPAGAIHETQSTRALAAYAGHLATPMDVAYRPSITGAAATGFARQALDSKGQRYVAGICDFDLKSVFNSDEIETGQTLGIWLIPDGGCSYGYCDDGELSETFDPPLSIAQLNSPRFWAASVHRYNTRADATIKASVPTWKRVPEV